MHPYTCAAVELRHGPLTMAAAKTWLAAERRAIERIRRQATPMPILAATRHRSPDEVETEPDHEPDPELDCAAAVAVAQPPASRTYREEGELVCDTGGPHRRPA